MNTQILEQGGRGTGPRKKSLRSTRALVAQKQNRIAALEEQIKAIEPVNRDSRRKLAAIQKNIRKLEREIRLLRAQTQEINHFE